VVVVEVVFTYPGIGQLMVNAVTSRDMPVVQACALVFAGAYILLNLLADVVSIVTNPRLLHPL
jgi:peptide/nickel transport system permease protein